MPYVPDIVSAMYMCCIHPGIRNRLGEPNLLPGAMYMVTQMRVYAMAGWAWQVRVGLVVPLAPWYRSSQSLVFFSFYIYPLTSLTSYHVRERCLAFC